MDVEEGYRSQFGVGSCNSPDDTNGCDQKLFPVDTYSNRGAMNVTEFVLSSHMDVLCTLKKEVLRIRQEKSKLA